MASCPQGDRRHQTVCRDLTLLVKTVILEELKIQGNLDCVEFSATLLITSFVLLLSLWGFRQAISDLRCELRNAKATRQESITICGTLCTFVTF